ncbi:hypothetical protein Q7C36_021541 [Tachysurus vachellii]|uniref:Uncharacterized protein n=1 Tax=Tachysurus vachellii TaxID=175792 RepID=A0AA88ISE0_TACVA|nr:hypothetical protein Q7C36_021541 [Tachysurus vachellii]
MRRRDVFLTVHSSRSTTQRRPSYFTEPDKDDKTRFTCLISRRVDGGQGLSLDKERTGAQSQPAATSL